MYVCVCVCVCHSPVDLGQPMATFPVGSCVVISRATDASPTCMCTHAHTLSQKQTHPKRTVRTRPYGLFLCVFVSLLTARCTHRYGWHNAQEANVRQRPAFKVLSLQRKGPRAQGTMSSAAEYAGVCYDASGSKLLLTISAVGFLSTIVVYRDLKRLYLFSGTGWSALHAVAGALV